MQVPMYTLSNKEDKASVFAKMKNLKRVMQGSEERELGNPGLGVHGRKVDLPK